MANVKQLEAMRKFNHCAPAVQRHVRTDGEYVVWLPQDKRTWRVDDKYGSPVCDAKGKPRRFMSIWSAVVFASELK